MSVYQVQIPRATFGIETAFSTSWIDEVVTEAAPIGRWMIGKRLKQIIRWVASRGGTLLALEDP